MSNYLALVIYMLSCYSAISCEPSPECRQEDPLLKIAISNDKDRKENLHAQINFSDGQMESPWQVDINHKPSCQIPATVTKTIEHPTPFYELFPGFGYYKLHTNPKNWDEAKATCEKEGAHLAVMNSKEEVEIVLELRRRLPKIFNSSYDDHVLVGITDREKEGSWKSIYNQSLIDTGYSEWHTKEPNGGTVENCGDIHTPSGKLNDFRCNIKLPFVCEKEL